jgi:hypothetical protein
MIWKRECEGDLIHAAFISIFTGRFVICLAPINAELYQMSLSVVAWEFSDARSLVYRSPAAEKKSCACDWFGFWNVSG